MLCSVDTTFGFLILEHHLAVRTIPTAIHASHYGQRIDGSERAQIGGLVGRVMRVGIGRVLEGRE